MTDSLLKIINEIMSKDRWIALATKTVGAFKSKTVSFTDLGYPDKKVYSVLIDGEEWTVFNPQKLSTRELNKMYKGKTAMDVFGNEIFLSLKGDAGTIQAKRKPSMRRMS